MTETELRLHDDKMRADIANIAAHTVKLQAEVEKLSTENKYYPLVVGSGATLAIVAIVKLFL